MNESTSENGKGTDALFDDPEVEIHRAVLRRERHKGSYPDCEAIAAMEVRLRRLTGATVQFADLAMLSVNDPPLSPMGLSFLAKAMNREALRLFRLYHGHPPRYPQYWADGCTIVDELRSA